MASHKLDKAESGTSKNGMVSPLSYQGDKGGNAASPSLGKPDKFTPADPCGFLPEGATERGKSGPGYGG